MKEFRKSYIWETDSKHSIADFRSTIWCYRGHVVNPKWEDVDTSESSHNHLFSDDT